MNFESLLFIKRSILNSTQHQFVCFCVLFFSPKSVTKDFTKYGIFVVSLMHLRWYFLAFLSC